MDKWAKWFSRVFVSTLFLIVSNYVYASGNNTFSNYELQDSAVVLLPNSSGIIGNNLVFGLEIDNATGAHLNSIQFGLHFDTTMVGIDWFNPDQQSLEGFTYLVNDSIPGIIYFSAISAGNNFYNGQVAQLQIKLKATGKTEFEIEDLLFNEGNPPASSLGGQLTILDPDTIPPMKPRQLTSKLVDAKTVQLDWVTGQDLDLKGYRIYMFEGNLDTEWTEDELKKPWHLSGVDLIDSLIVDSPAPINQVLSKQIDELKDLTHYQFWVTAFDSIGNESLGEFVSIRSGDTEPPKKPNFSTVQQNGSQVYLEWTAQENSDIEQYVLYRSENLFFDGLKENNIILQRVTTTPGDVEKMVLFNWDVNTQTHQLLLDKREFPDSVDASSIDALKLLDIYEGPISYDNTGSAWITYYIPEEISESVIEASDYAENFRKLNGAYGVSVDIGFEKFSSNETSFELVGMFGSEQLNYTDSDIINRHSYNYTLAAIDSSNGDPLIHFDPALKSEFSDTINVITPFLTWLVNKTGEGDYEFIQEAIDGSEPGDTISVDAGEYQEQLRISHPLTLRNTAHFEKPRIIKPNDVDTLIMLNAQKFTANAWPLNHGLHFLGLDISGTNDEKKSGVGISLNYGTSMRLEKAYISHFNQAITGSHSSYSVYNSIFNENLNISEHKNHLYASTQKEDTIKYVHVNILNTNSYITDLDGAIDFEFQNSIIADRVELQIGEKGFQGSGVKLTNVAIDTNLVRTERDEVQVSHVELLNNQNSSLTHINNIDQILFKSLVVSEDFSNYRLQPQSTVIGSGNPSVNIPFDFLDQKRDSYKDDLGAIEHPNVTPDLFASPSVNIMQIDTSFNDGLNSAVQININYPDSLLSKLDAIYLSKWSNQDELLQIDTLKTGTFIDFDVFVGATYSYSAQARMYDIYLGEISEKESIFINEIAPPLDVDPPTSPINLTAKRLDTRVFDFEWKVDPFDELSHFNIYRILSTEVIVEAFIDTIDATWLWSGGIYPLDELKNKSIELFDSLSIPFEAFEQAKKDSIELLFNWVDDKDLSIQTSYTYWVTSVDLAGNEGDARFVKIQTGDDKPPTPPSNIIQIIQGDKLVLEWESSPDDDVKWYKIYKGLDSTAVSLYDSVEADVRMFEDKITDFGVQTFYRISAVDSSISDPLFSFDPALEGELSESTPGYVIDITGPSKPIIESVYSANSLVEIDWALITDPDLEYHNIYRGSHPDTVEVIDITPADDTFYSDSTVENGLLYYYFISGVDSLSNEGDLSDVVIGTPYNIQPSVAPYEDLYIHNQESDQFEFPFVFQGFDNDGVIDSTLWLVGNELVSDEKNPSIGIRQGSNHITVIGIDNDGARDSSSFSVYVDAGFIDLGSNLVPTSGLSIFGNNFSFQPDGRGNLSLMTPEESNEFILTAPLQAPVAIASDSSFYLLSGTQKLSKYSLFSWWKHKITVPYWSSSTGGVHSASPVIDEKRKRLYLASMDNQIYGIGMAAGIQKWSSNLGGSGIHPGVIISEKYLAQPNKLGDIIYFDLDASISFKEMSPLGKTIFDDGLLGALSLTRDNELVAAFASGTIRKWSPNLSSGSIDQIKWETDLATAFQTTPVIAENGLILVGGSDSTFYGINGDNGQVQWTYKASDSITSTASINEYGIIYFGDASGGVYAIDDTGDLIWDYQIEADDDASSLSVMNTINYVNGSVFVATQGGKLVRIRDGWRYDGSFEEKFGPQWEEKQAQWATYQGNYRRSGNVDMSVSTSSEDIESLPTEFKLLQNYPNPFNPSTKIEFSLPEASLVRLEVFNTLGQRVQTLKNEKMPAGKHSVTFEAFDLTTGVYLYRLTAGEFSQINRMLLIK